MIRECQKTFILETEQTTYCFGVTPTGHLEHLYYGRKIRLEEGSIDALKEKRVYAPGNVNTYDAAHTGFSLEDVRLEMSSYGK